MNERSGIYSGQMIFCVLILECDYKMTKILFDCVCINKLIRMSLLRNFLELLFRNCLKNQHISQPISHLLLLYSQILFLHYPT